MRKGIITPPPLGKEQTEPEWINVENLARAELSSENGAYPIESALCSEAGPGWRAEEPGPQIIRFIFDKEIAVRLVRLEFCEFQDSRTQEFLLRWSPDYGRTYQEIVRQQYNFNPPTTDRELEEYQVNLPGLTILELTITPSIDHSRARASLARLQLA
jgi:hypothetical protein